MRIDKNKVQIKMAKLGINQHELAERADISRQTLSYIIMLMYGKEASN